MKQAKINTLLLVNKDCDFVYHLRKNLLNFECEVSYVNNFDELINKLMCIRSCILFFNKDTLKEFGYIGKFINTDLFNKCTIVYVGSSAEVEEYVGNVNFFVCSQNQVNSLLQNIINQYKLTSSNKVFGANADKLNNLLNDYLLKLGFTQKWIGYKFIKDSLLICVDKDYTMRNLNNNVYPYVATMNNTTASNVERSIRNAIIKAYENTQFQHKEFAGLFGNSGKITNKLFLACMLDKINEYNLKQQAS